MGYSNGFVASIILKNSPLREFKYSGKRTVKVPFGAEYVIRLKNKSKDPALVEVSIDGTDVLNGSELVLKAGQTVDLERFVENNSSGKKFKYISLEEGSSTGEIDDPYRDENGLVRVTFHKAFHIPKSTLTVSHTFPSPSFCEAVVNHDYYVKGGPSYVTNDITFKSKSTLVGSALNSRGMASDSVATNSFFSSVAPLVSDAVSDLDSDKGATVEGSDSDQSFSSTSEYHKLSLGAVVDIYMVGPNYKEEVAEAEWGVFLQFDKKPVATFKEKKHAHLFAGNADFGRSMVTVKEIV